MPQPVNLPFLPWEPDRAPVEGQSSYDTKNAYPIGNGWAPWQDHSAFSDALTARCQGAYAAKDQSANAVNFAGDASKLYKLGTDNLWDDVSRTSGGAYTTNTDEYWEFAQFGSNVIAVNATDAPQKYVIASSTNFGALGGSPPTARHIGVVRDFVVLGNLSTSAQSIHWSGFNNSESWTVGVDQSDVQEFPDGGWVQGIVGGEVGYIIQERSIRRLTYTGGDVIFQIDEVERNRGTRASKSIVEVGGTFFYLGQDGFYWFTGDASRPIGAERVDRWFYDTCDQSYLYRVVGSANPTARCVLWSFPSRSTVDGTPDTIIGYRWDIDRWFKIDKSIEFLGIATTQGYTLEDLDAISADIDALPASLDSILWTGGATDLAAFDTNHKLGYFNGDSLAATLFTEEKALAGGRIASVSNSIPIIDASDATVAVSTRMRAADSRSYSSEGSMRSSGYCPVRGTGRLVSARLTVPAASSWTYAEAVQIESRVTGKR